MIDKLGHDHVAVEFDAKLLLCDADAGMERREQAGAAFLVGVGMLKKIENFNIFELDLTKKHRDVPLDFNHACSLFKRHKINA